MPLFDNLNGTLRASFQLGKADASDKMLYANVPGSDKPGIRWNGASSWWETSADGLTWTRIGAASGADTYIQFANASGMLASSIDFIFDDATKSLKLNQAIILPDNPLAISGDVDSYLQTNIQNLNAGLTASTDLVVTNDLGTDGTNYVDLGINSSGYSAPAFSITGANDCYLVASDGHLAIGTAAAGKQLKFHTGGTTAEKLRATVDDLGINLPALHSFRVDGAALPFLTDTAPVDAIPQTAAEGVATTAARSDHAHNVPVATPVGIVTTANAEGTADTLARSDHAHNLAWATVRDVLGTQAGVNVGYTFKSDGANSGAMLKDVVTIDHRLTVGKAGDVDYTSIAAAISAAIAAGGGVDGQAWEITVNPGVYTEPPMTLPVDINVVSGSANRISEVTITASNPNADLFTCTGGVLAGMTLEGVTNAANCLVRCNTTLALTVLHGIAVRNCSRGIYVGNGAIVVATDFTIQIGGPGQEIGTAVYVTGAGSYFGSNGGYFSCNPALLPYYAINPVQRCAHVTTGAEAFFIGFTCRVARIDDTADVFFADNGAAITVMSTEMSGCGTAFHIGSVGSGTEVITQGVVLGTNYQNGWVESATGTLFAFGSALSSNTTLVAGASLVGVFQARADRAFNLIGLGYYVFPTGKSVNIPDYFADFSSTGVCEGGIVTAGAGLHVDVTAGDGWSRRGAPDDDVAWVEWAAVTALVLTASTTNYVYFDQATSAIVAGLAAPGVSSILLATVVTDSAGIRYLHNTRNVLDNTIGRMHQYLLDTRKKALKSGCATVQGTTVRKINVGSGAYYIALNALSFAGSGGDATFSYFYGTNGATEITGQTLLDITQYDNAGTLTAMTAGYYRSDSVIVTSDGRISIVYGTAQYATQVLAEAAALANVPTFMEATAFPSARVIVLQGTGIASVVDARTVPAAGSGGGGGGVSVHSALAGLSADDHTQYLLGNGTRAMTGALNMGANAISNVGTVDGVTVSAHAARHAPGGADALATANPVAVSIAAAVAEGTATSYARSDHQHGIAAGSPVAVGTANADGTASALARADHVHAALTRTAADFATFTEKTTPVLTDLVLIEDSAAAGAKKRVQLGNLPRNTLAVAHAIAASHTPGLAFANIPFATTSLETNTAIVDHLAANNDRIRVFEAGTYQVMYGWYGLSSVSVAVLTGQVVINDTTAVTYSTSVSSNYLNEGSTNFMSCPITLAAGDYVTVQGKVASGTATFSNLFFSVQKLDGLKGATGATGSGSTITVQENGIALANTPHSVLNFGPGVTAIDAGAGVAQVFLDAYPPIGDITTTTPATPAAGTTLFSRFRSGRHMTGQVGPSGMDYAFQPSLFGNKISWFSANGNTTVASSFNYVASVTGTATLRTVATSSFFNSMRRLGHVSAAPAGSSAGMRYAAAMWWRGNAAGFGGFHMITRFGVSATAAGMRLFVGMSATTGAFANVDPSTLFNLVGIALDTADANLQFIYNDGAAAATKINLGASWPRPTASTQVYEFRLFVAPNGGTFYWSLENLDPANRAVIEGDSTLVPANIPSNTTLLCPQVWINNGAAVTAVAIDVISQYIETDV